MKKNLLFVVTIAVFGLLFAGLGSAQDDRKLAAAAGNYVISAKAGGVNDVEGKVSIDRRSGKSGQLLKGDEANIGDRVATAADGKAEILLNPGSFVRLGGSSEFEFVSTDLDNLQLKLKSGSAILEVYADDEFKVTLSLPDAAIELTKSGVYRVDVLADGSGKISVWKGRVELGAEKGEIKAGKSAIVKGKTSSAIAKFDRDNKDELDVWSELRAKEASKINAKLRKNALNNSLMSAYNTGGWNLFGTLGLWVFDPITQRWCFLPFGAGWRSPYGYGFGYDIWNCRLPNYVYTQPPPQPQTPGTSTPTTPTTPGTPMTPQQAETREARRRNMHRPSFERFENNQREVRGGGSRTADTGDGDSTSRGGGGWPNTRTRRDPADRQPTFTPAPTYKPSTPKETPAPTVTPTRREPKPKG